jgi:hypothetical protein
MKRLVNVVQKLDPAVVRFMEKVQKTDSCWIWLGSKDKDGYGWIRAQIPGGVTRKAHRFAYAHFRGTIPDGMQVCHTCDNPSCVNPDHLFLGTVADNQKDMRDKGRDRKLKGAECPRALITEEMAIAILRDPRRHAVIAEEYGIRPSTVSSIKTKVSWRYLTEKAATPSPMVPNKQGKSKLFTEKDIREIRSCTEPLKMIATRYGSSVQTICDIRKRRRWQHVL